MNRLSIRATLCLGAAALMPLLSSWLAVMDDSRTT